MTKDTVVELSYGDSAVGLRVPDTNLLAILSPSQSEPVSDPETELVRAIRQPIGQPRLQEMVAGREDVLIVVDLSLIHI